MKTIRILKEVMNFRPGAVIMVGRDLTDTQAEFLVSKGFAESADTVGKVREPVTTGSSRKAVSSGA